MHSFKSMTLAIPQAGIVWAQILCITVLFSLVTGEVALTSVPQSTIRFVAIKKLLLLWDLLELLNVWCSSESTRLRDIGRSGSCAHWRCETAEQAGASQVSSFFSSNSPFLFSLVSVIVVGQDWLLWSKWILHIPVDGVGKPVAVTKDKRIVVQQLFEAGLIPRLRHCGWLGVQ